MGLATSGSQGYEAVKQPWLSEMLEKFLGPQRAKGGDTSEEKRFCRKLEDSGGQRLGEYVKIGR